MTTTTVTRTSDPERMVHDVKEWELERDDTPGTRKQQNDTATPRTLGFTPSLPDPSVGRREPSGARPLELTHCCKRMLRSPNFGGHLFPAGRPLPWNRGAFGHFPRVSPKSIVTDMMTGTGRPFRIVGWYFH